MKSVLKIIAFAIAFVAVGQSFYKAYASQSELSELETMQVDQRLVELLQTKALYEARGAIVPVQLRMMLIHDLETVTDELKKKEKKEGDDVSSGEPGV